jgi:6-phosphogluconolactonase
VNPEILIDNRIVLQRKLLSEFETRARSAIAERGAFIVALPGGSVATTFFPALATAAVDWTRTEFFWVDERAVPPEDSESNFALAQNLWLTVASIPRERIHRMHGEAHDLEEAARKAAAELTSIAGDPPRLDVALLGVGEDGHVASIFPGRDTSDSHSNLLVVAVYDAPKPPARRLSLGLRVLAGAERVVIAAVGRSKASAVRDALQARPETPLASLLNRARSSLLLLDRGAAELLSGEEISKRRS